MYILSYSSSKVNTKTGRKHAKTQSLICCTTPTPVSESLKLPRAAEVVAKERGGCARNFPSSDVTSAAFVSSFIPRIDQSAEWESESRLTRDPRDRRGVCEERERERTRLRLVNFLRWSSHPTAIGRYMKACRAPSTCHKATEENLSRIDTLAWSYPKVRIVDLWVVNPLLSFETGEAF